MNGTSVRKRGGDETIRLNRGDYVDLQPEDVICIPSATASEGYWELEFCDPQHTTDAAGTVGTNLDSREE